MNIITITFHYSINYGAVLQCFALQKQLQLMGHNVKVLNYAIPELFRVQRVFKTTTKKGIIRKYFSFIKQAFRYIMTYQKNKNQIVREKKFQKFISKYITLTRKIKTKIPQRIISKTDSFIVGSDQVWNTRITFGIDNIYYLKNINKLKISYAASIGENELEERYQEELLKSINVFDSISIREESSINYLKEKMDKPIFNAVDPVFLLNKNEYLNLTIPHLIKEKFVLVYCVDSDPKFYELVNNLNRKYPFKFIALNDSLKYNKEIIFFNAGIEEFLSLIKDCEFIITNSFHGLAFSLIFEKEFLLMPHSSRPERQLDLLKKVNLERQLIRNIHDFNKSLLEKINYKNVNKLLECEARNSIEFLTKSLKG